jgi:hypothetical protein
VEAIPVVESVGSFAVGVDAVANGVGRGVPGV